jgi:molybdenum cofactor biosynthesis enzyme MoaA
VIASVTQAFCHNAPLRQSTDGRLYTCLFANEATTSQPVARREAINTCATVSALCRAG